MSRNDVAAAEGDWGMERLFLHWWEWPDRKEEFDDEGEKHGNSSSDVPEKARGDGVQIFDGSLRSMMEDGG